MGDMVKVEYLKAKGENTNCIKVELYYQLGGFNCFTYKQEERGYVVGVSPIQKSGICEIYTGFSGVKECIVPCSRKSKSSEAKALEMYEANKKKLVDYICNKNNLVLI